mgnify:FL=1
MPPPTTIVEDALNQDELREALASIDKARNYLAYSGTAESETELLATITVASNHLQDAARLLKRIVVRKAPTSN